jgi:phenylalanyl-tRNA synthetase alpha chain
MADDIASLRSLSLAGVAAAADLRALEGLRVHLLGKAGALTQLLKGLGKASPEERRSRGAALNLLRDDIVDAMEARRAVLETQEIAARLVAERMDVSLPPRVVAAGTIHPISRTLDEMAAIFGAMGFRIARCFINAKGW